MKFVSLGMFLVLITSITTQEEKAPIIYVKHLEPPLHYPPLARQTLLQGTVVVKVTIAPDGAVQSEEPLTREQDPQANAHPVLRDETVKLVKKWTFACLNCVPNVPYEEKIRFMYRIEGEGIPYDDTKVVMDLPDQVTITVSPPECDHCPPKKKGNR